MTGKLTFYQDKDCSGGVVVTLENERSNLKAGDGTFPDDRASSLKLVNIPKHTYIAVFDNQHGQINDDWTEIFVLQDIEEYCIGSFEQTHMDEHIVMYYYPLDGLDGHVSRIEIEQRGSPHGQLVFFTEKSCQGKAIMAFRDTADHTYKKGDGHFKNDAVSSMRLLGVKAGTVIKIHDDAEGRDSADWAEIKVRKDITSYDIGSFEQSVTDDYVEMNFHKHNGLDGKVSYISVGHKQADVEPNPVRWHNDSITAESVPLNKEGYSLVDETTETESKSLNVFVIGGTTDAGRAAIRYLVREGHTVAASTAEATQGAVKIREDGGLPTFIDPLRSGELAGMFRMIKADVVINLWPQLANQPPFSSSEIVPEMLVQQAHAVTQAAKDAGVKFIVHASFAFLYGDTHGAEADERASLAASGKLAHAARKAEEIIVAGAVPAAILRSGYVYGAESPVMIKVVENMRVGRPVPTGSGAKTAAWVYADDLGKAAALAAIQQPAGEIFNVADDAPCSPLVFVDDLSETIGVGRQGVVPSLMGFLVGLRPNNELLNYSVKVNTTKIKQQLGWEPDFPSRAAGFDRMLLFWRAGTLDISDSVKPPVPGADIDPTALLIAEKEAEAAALPEPEAEAEPEGA